MQMVDAAQRLDWQGWLRGVIGALISGGAGAVSSGVSISFLDPAHDINILKVMGITFLVSGVISMLKFLAITPVPNEVTIQQTTVLTQTTQTTGKQ
jgi:hypothetical protein